MVQNPFDTRAGRQGSRGAEEIVTERHALTLLPGMEETLAAIARDVETARRRVLVETYIHRDDRLGRAFGDALVRAARRGVPTRLLYDPLGSQETNASFFDDLRLRGVQVRAYRPLRLALGEGTVWPRDHSRVLVLDDQAYTGGAAWGDEWLPREDGGEGWYDVCVRTRGPVVEDFARLFELRWREAGAEHPSVRDFTTGGEYPDLVLVGDSTAGTTRVYDRFRAAVRAARKRIWIENAYFFPPYRLLRDLCDAARRGVEVEIVVPSWSDLPSIQRAARAEMSLWLARGLRVWEYRPRMLHGKFAVIDGDFCTVGTFNMNPTSLWLANEVSLFVRDRAFVGRVADLFAEDRSLSTPVTPEALASRPLGTQILDHLAHGALSLADRWVERSA